MFFGFNKKPLDFLSYARWINKIEPLSFIGCYEGIEIKSPLVSIILFDEHDNATHFLNDSIKSVLNQESQNWELILEKQGEFNSDAGLDEDPRVIFLPKQERPNFCEFSNKAVLKCNGGLVIFIHAGDKLSQKAVMLLAASSASKIIVSDEDFLNDSGQRHHPYFKPDWNPDYLFNYNYFSYGVAYSRELFIELGGFDMSTIDPHHALALKAVSQSKDNEILHIDKILFHLKEKKVFEVLRVQYDLSIPHPLVTIIIPTRDHAELLKVCINGLLKKTSYENIEIIIVNNQSTDNEALTFLEKIEKYSNISVISYDKPFNYSDMNNIAAKKANGDLLCFLNNDISVINDGWLTEMVSEAIRPEIGCVGAKLFYPDGTIQHAGVTLGLKGYASHAHKGFPGDSTGYFNRLQVTHNVSAVTGACMVVRKELFELVGGLDAVNLKIAYSDVDFCLKVRESGYRNLFTPHAQLIHHESKSRGKKRGKKEQKVLRAESKFFREKWGDLLTSDPAYNKNLTLLKEDFSLGFDRLEH